MSHTLTSLLTVKASFFLKKNISKYLFLNEDQLQERNNEGVIDHLFLQWTENNWAPPLRLGRLFTVCTN